MPFDPSLPQTNSPISSAELRDQFNGLKTLIDDRPTIGDVNEPVDNLTNTFQGAIETQPSGNVASVADLSLSIPTRPIKARSSKSATRSMSCWGS